MKKSVETEQKKGPMVLWGYIPMDYTLDTPHGWSEPILDHFGMYQAQNLTEYSSSILKQLGMEANCYP